MYNKRQLGTCDLSNEPHEKQIKDIHGAWCLNWKPLEIPQENEQVTSPYLDKKISEISEIVDKRLDKASK